MSEPPIDRCYEDAAERQALEADNERLREAIYWALGERDEFPEEPPPLNGKWRQRYWWRRELRRRAFDVDDNGADQPPPATDPERVEIARCPRCGGLPRPTLLGRTICDRCGGLDVPQPPSPTVLRQVEALTASQPDAATDDGATPLDGLTCRIKDNQILITISAAALKTATDNHPEFWDGETDRNTVAVIDQQEWLKSVTRHITYEREDGSSYLTDIFDAAIKAAVENGEEGCEEVTADNGSAGP